VYTVIITAIRLELVESRPVLKKSNDIKSYTIDQYVLQLISYTQWRCACASQYTWSRTYSYAPCTQHHSADSCCQSVC